MFLHATMSSVESIVIEALRTDLSLGPLVIAANSIPIAGAVLLLITYAIQRERGFEVFGAWKHLLPGSTLLAAGIFLWYDSVGM